MYYNVDQFMALQGYSDKVLRLQESGGGGVEVALRTMFGGGASANSSFIMR